MYLQPSGQRNLRSRNKKPQFPPELSSPTLLLQLHGKWPLLPLSQQGSTMSSPWGLPLSRVLLFPSSPDPLQDEGKGHPDTQISYHAHVLPLHTHMADRDTTSIRTFSVQVMKTIRIILPDSCQHLQCKMPPCYYHFPNVQWLKWTCPTSLFLYWGRTLQLNLVWALSSLLLWHVLPFF